MLEERAPEGPYVGGESSWGGGGGGLYVRGNDGKSLLRTQMSLLI